MLPTILAACLIILPLLWHWRRNRAVSAIPDVKGQLPLLGLVHKFATIGLKDYARILLDIASDSVPIQKAWFGPWLAVVPNTPESVRVVLTSPLCTHKPAVLYDGFFSPLGMLANNGDVQDRHRRILGHSMTPSMLAAFNPIFNEKSKRFVRKMATRAGEFDVYRDVAACTLEVLMKGQFQHEHDCYGSDVIEAFERSKDVMMRRMMQPWMKVGALYRASRLACDVRRVMAPIYRKIDEILGAKRELRVESERRHAALICQLLNSKNGFSEAEIRDEIFIWIFGGFETTAVTLSICLVLLAMHKDVQQRVIDEIEGSNLDGDDFTLTNDDTQGFPYIESVLKETMRLFPVAPAIVRQTTGEIELEGHRVPSGTLLPVPIFFLHRSERIWGEDAKKFRPERFEPGKAAAMHPFAFVPFSSGKRMCIGHKYAMIFMKIFVVNFFKKLAVDTSLKFEDIELQLTPTISFINGYGVSVRERRKEGAGEAMEERVRSFMEEKKAGGDFNERLM